MTIHLLSIKPYNYYPLINQTNKLLSSNNNINQSNNNNNNKGIITKDLFTLVNWLIKINKYLMISIKIVLILVVSQLD